MLKFLTSVFSGNALQSLERVASEWIETDTEKAEAKTVLIKALDPNGMMRRQLSRDVTKMYKVYLFTMVLLVSLEFLCAFFNIKVNTEALAIATAKLVELFVPITSLFGVIVTTSFGVNAYNVKKNSNEGS